MIFHSDENDQDDESKTTSEKPVSLSPLSLKKAMEGLLKIKPKEDKEANKEETNN